MQGPVYVSDLTTKRPILGSDDSFPVGATLPSSFSQAVADDPHRSMFVEPSGVVYTVSDFYQLARRVAKGVIAADVAPNQGVCILGANAVRWFAADWGAVLAATIPSPSYVTNSVRTIAYMLDLTNTGICFVDDKVAMEKLIAAKAESVKNSLRYIVCWDTHVDLANYRDHASYLLTWDEFLQSGDLVPDSAVDERMALAKPESCAKIIFTSGTTGIPKAAMISHDNICWIAHAIKRDFRILKGDTLVSYLPASHIAANAMDCVGPVFAGITVFLARPDALRGSLIDTLREVRPTLFVAVPRVWEKFHERMVSMRSSMSVLTTKLSDWAKSVGERASLAEDSHKPMPWGSTVAYYLVHANVRYALGLNNARLILNTAAPLMQSTSDYFRCFRIKIMDVYGMSEATGTFTFGPGSEARPKSSGKVHTGLEVKLHMKDANNEGELCFKGRSLFLGYLNEPTLSAEAFDEEGYFHTGDLGRLDSENFVYITGRVKDLMKTSGGENVAPAAIEEALVGCMPAIAYAVAIGDKRRFISCLLVPRMDESGNLEGSALHVSPHVRSGTEAAKSYEWDEYVTRGIEAANAKAVSNVAKVKKFTILCNNFRTDSPGGLEKGELTPTMKVRRSVVYEKYSREIEAMYSQ